MFGELRVFAGPMFAGKTESLVKEILFRTYFASEEPGRVGVFRPVADSRYGRDCIMSHAGASVQAVPAGSTQDVDWRGLRFAFFDEVQFFAAPYFQGDLPGLVRAMRRHGVDVFCAGLDMDYMGRAFEVTAGLIAEATHFQRLAARCEMCGAPATHTARESRDPARFKIGSIDEYAAMCPEHWLDASARHGAELAAPV